MTVHDFQTGKVLKEAGLDPSRSDENLSFDDLTYEDLSSIALLYASYLREIMEAVPVKAQDTGDSKKIEAAQKAQRSFIVLEKTMEKL